MILNPNSDDKQVENFKYIGSFIGSTLKDIDIRIAKAISELNSMHTILKSKMSDNLKRSFFRATFESVLVYGAITWTLISNLEKKS